MTRLGIEGAARYRTVGEARIVELLLIHGWPLELRAGRRAEAEGQARAALDRFVDQGLAHGRAGDGGRLFDPAEVSNFLERAGMDRAEATWESRCVSTARRLVWAAHGGSGGGGVAPAPDALAPGRYGVTLRRTFNLAGRRAGERVRLRLPLPIKGAALWGLEVTVRAPEGLVAAPEVAPARLDAVVAAPEGGEASLEARSTFTAASVVAAAGAARLDPAEAELYTRPSEGLIKVSPRVRALAGALAGGETDPWALMGRFWRFMLDELVCGAVHHDELDPAAPVDWALERGWYDCQIGSALVAALCRARGLPARTVSGYMLYEAAPAFHTWLEVWMDGRGWVPFDLLSFDLSAGGRHAGWRDYFFGRLDHRMPVQRPPRLFNGAGSVRLPPAWHMLTAPDGAGTSIAFHALDTGALVWRDHVVVERLA